MRTGHVALDRAKQLKVIFVPSPNQMVLKLI